MQKQVCHLMRILSVQKTLFLSVPVELQDLNLILYN